MKVGFVDYYLDEWHANNYPGWIKEASGGEIEVAYAYALTDSPRGGLATDEWCRKFGVKRCYSPEELAEKSDAIVVLAPDNPERHEELCRVPMQTRKPVYVDKTFAQDLAAARRIFEIAEQSGTPCYSTSPLRYAEEYRAVEYDTVTAASFLGGGDYVNYSVHLLEPLVMFMRAPGRRVMCLPSEGWLHLNVEFSDGRCGTFTLIERGSPFVSSICTTDGSHFLQIKSDFFHCFILELVEFFRTGIPRVPHEQTLMLMAIRDAGAKALKHPGEWVEVEQV